MTDGAQTALHLIQKWCHRHTSGHDPTTRADRASSAMPMTHATDRRGLERLADTGRLEPRANRPLYFFAGPSRRKPPLGAAAALIFRPGAECSPAVEHCEASQYDSGGAAKYAGISASEKTAAMQHLTMTGSTFRTYLEAFLSCAFEAPSDYLSDTPGPDLDLPATHDVAHARVLANVLEKRSDPCCWTVEVRLRVHLDELDLTSCADRGELECLCVLGSEFEPQVTKLESRLGDDIVHFVPDTTNRTTEDGLARSLREQDTRDATLRGWTAERIRTMLEQP
jgi:hypothetical protein